MTERREYIIHKDFCDAITTALSSEFSNDELSISFGENTGVAVSGDMTVYFRMIYGKFPPYKQIIPPFDAECVTMTCEAPELV